MTVILDQNALTTLERVRTDLGFSVTTNDAKILRAINAASGMIELYCGRLFWRDTAIVEKSAGYGTTKMRLKRRPINSIASIAYDDLAVDSDDYEIDNATAGLVDKVGGWTWTAHAVRDISRGVLPGTERKLYTVTYDGGWYTPEQSRAQGTLTFTAVPANLETMVLNLTTITAKTSGASTDEFDIGSDARATCDNLVAAINAGSESDNVRAWRVGLTVVIEFLEEGTDGNTVVFTETLANTTADGSGTLGGTQAGVARGLPWDLEDACVELARDLYLAKNKNPGVAAERLLSWSTTYGTGGGKGVSKGGAAAGFPASVARVLDQYKVLT